MVIKKRKRDIIKVNYSPGFTVEVIMIGAVIEIKDSVITLSPAIEIRAEEIYYHKYIKIFKQFCFGSEEVTEEDLFLLWKRTENKNEIEDIIFNKIEEKQREP